MEKAEAYRTYAEQCMELADRMPPDARPQLIQMAEAWLELARSELALVAATRGDQPQ